MLSQAAVKRAIEDFYAVHGRGMRYLELESCFPGTPRTNITCKASILDYRGEIVIKRRGKKNFYFPAYAREVQRIESGIRRLRLP